VISWPCSSGISDRSSASYRYQVLEARFELWIILNLDRLCSAGGRSQTMTHDYKRKVRPLFSPPSLRPTPRSTGFVMNGIDTRNGSSFSPYSTKAMPAHLDLHSIGDNYATHKHSKVQRRFQRRPRFHMHFLLLSK
jgi:hypothetical protein